MEDKREISKEEALQFQKEYNLDFFMEISTKTSDISDIGNIIFTEAAKLLYNEYLEYKNLDEYEKSKKWSNKNLKEKKLYNFLNY